MTILLWNGGSNKHITVGNWICIWEYLLHKNKQIFISDKCLHRNGQSNGFFELIVPHNLHVTRYSKVDENSCGKCDDNSMVAKRKRNMSHV